MLVPFDKLPDESRIWIYPSSKYFDKNISIQIAQKTEEFISTWHAHQQPLSAGVLFPYNQFIVIGVDEKINKVSGCSIDSSVHFIQSLEQQYDITLLDKMNVTFKQGKSIVYKPLNEFIEMVKNNSVSKNTLVFNNLVSTKKEFESQWEAPAEKSWHNRYFK